MGFSIETSVSAVTVFLQGALSFFSPCVLPLVPLYVSYLAGGAAVVGEDGVRRYPRGKIFLNTLFFVVGISFAFFLLGLGLTALGEFFHNYQVWFARASGVIILLFGLYQLGLGKRTMLLEREHRLPFRLDRWAMNPLVALVLGFTFSFAWTPCVGPTLSSVLLMASSAESSAAGFLLIGVYTLGFVLPFLAVGLFTGTVLDFFKSHQNVVRYTVKIGAVLLIVMGVSAALLGGIWAFIPGFFKAKWNTNETLFTLMMNYIMIGIVRWLKGGPWEGRPGSQIIPNFDKAAVLPKVFGVHCGWIIVLVLVVFMHIYMKYTKHGYEIAVIGDSVNTARYAGMNVGRIMMRTMFLSGAICGLVGFMVASGANMTLSDTVAAGNGFTAITVAWLSQLNAFAMIIISLMLAILSKGAETLQTRLMVPTSISDIITGILLFCMLGCEFFINYQIIFRGKSSAKEGAKV